MPNQRGAPVALATEIGERGWMALTPAHLEALDRDGFIVVEDALDAVTVGRLLRAFSEAPVQVHGTQHVVITAETPERQAWLDLERHPLTSAAAEHILGRPYTTDAHGRNPLPGYGQQGLHADGLRSSDDEPYNVVTAIWMLDAFVPNNGSTRVVPGSHRVVRPLPKALAQPASVHPDEVVIQGRAGSVLILNGHLLHSGRRNDSNGPRRAIQHVMRTEGSAYAGKQGE